MLHRSSRLESWRSVDFQDAGRRVWGSRTAGLEAQSERFRVQGLALLVIHFSDLLDHTARDNQDCEDVHRHGDTHPVKLPLHSQQPLGLVVSWGLSFFLLKKCPRNLDHRVSVQTETVGSGLLISFKLFEW